MRFQVKYKDIACFASQVESDHLIYFPFLFVTLIHQSGVKKSSQSCYPTLLGIELTVVIQRGGSGDQHEEEERSKAKAQAEEF